MNNDKLATIKLVEPNKNKFPDNPNIIFVFPDQLGAEVLNCYGNEDVISPNINKFVEEGLLFERAYTASPVCTPFRGTLFTGRYPSQTGVKGKGMRLPHSELTLPELFGQGGYLTSYLGKWHLSGQPGGNRPIPAEERAGFEDFIAWESHHVDHWQGLIFADGNQDLEGFNTIRCSSDGSDLNVDNLDSNTVNSSNDDNYIKIKMEGHETDGLTELVCHKLNEIKDEQFCLFVSYQAPHPPSTLPEEYLNLYKER